MVILLSGFDEDANWDHSTNKLSKSSMFLALVLPTLGSYLAGTSPLTSLCIQLFLPSFGFRAGLFGGLCWLSWINLSGLHGRWGPFMLLFTKKAVHSRSLPEFFWACFCFNNFAAVRVSMSLLFWLYMLSWERVSWCGGIDLRMLRERSKTEMAQKTVWHFSWLNFCHGTHSARNITFKRSFMVA